MPDHLVDAEEMIRLARPGTMIYASGEFASGAQDGERYVSLLVREDAAHIAKLGPHPLVEIRAGIFPEPAVVTVSVLVKIRSEVYESWWNYHQPVGVNPFERMTAQVTFPVLFFSEHGRARAIGIPNGMREFFAQAIRLIALRPSWAMRDFDDARRRVEERYPSVPNLWLALGEHFQMRYRVN